jgi:hypothetical protein
MVLLNGLRIDDAQTSHHNFEGTDLMKPEMDSAQIHLVLLNLNTNSTGVIRRGS